jgi:23S rRNA pseudouridine2605 synthase
MQQRIQKILSAHGVTSRRNAEKLVAQGRVSINGSAATIGQSADVSVDEILVDGKVLKKKDETVYIMLNKPIGYVTTMSDEAGRKTVLDLIQGVDGRVYPIGRLDINTEGLLLMTNDGDFANKIMHPSKGITKVYRVCVVGDISVALGRMRGIMNIDSHTIKAEFVNVLDNNSDNSDSAEMGEAVLEIGISQGINRQVRKMCAACGLKVKSLKRVSIGNLLLGNLKSGKYRFLSENEIKSI